MARKTLTDKSGTFDLSDVHSVTPSSYVTDPKTKAERTIGVLHHASGHTLATDTDYADVVKQVFGEPEKK